MMGGSLRGRGFGVVGLVAAVVLGAAGSAGAQTTTTSSFTAPGEYSFTVPAGVTSIEVTAVGAAGGESAGGDVAGLGASAGGLSSGTPAPVTVPVSSGEQLSVTVGAVGAQGVQNGSVAGGFGGGGATGVAGFSGGGGGGASAVAAESPFPWSALVVAGGGGGGGYGQNGGDADTAAAGCNQSVCAGGGGAGTHTSGGPGGAGADGGGAGGAGQFGLGGMSAGGRDGGGGGGGGYYGGGGGGGSGDAFAYAGGGGGGSSYVSPLATVTSAPAPTSAAAEVTISYAAPQLIPAFGSLGFAATALGVSSGQLTDVIYNTGDATLVISGWSLSGSNPGDYLVDDECQSPVPAGGSCYFGVRFDPQATGASEAYLSFVSNAANLVDSVTLGGTGAQAPPITCNNTLLARLICAIAFPSTEWTAAGPIQSVTATVSHNGVVDAVATAHRPQRQLKLHFHVKHTLKHGRYKLTLRVTSTTHHVRTYTRTVSL
jgi:hypothetical protein